MVVGRRKLYAVQPAGLAALHGLAKGADDVSNLVLFQCVGDFAVIWLRDLRRGNEGEPLLRIRCATPAQVRELGHDPGAVLMHRGGQLPVVGDDAVVAVGRMDHAVAGELAVTLVEPPKIVSPTPPLAFST